MPDPLVLPGFGGSEGQTLQGQGIMHFNTNAGYCISRKTSITNGKVSHNRRILRQLPPAAPDKPMRHIEARTAGDLGGCSNGPAAEPAPPCSGPGLEKPCGEYELLCHLAGVMKSWTPTMDANHLRAPRFGIHTPTAARAHVPINSFIPTGAAAARMTPVSASSSTSASTPDPNQQTPDDRNEASSDGGSGLSRSASLSSITSTGIWEAGNQARSKANNIESIVSNGGFVEGRPRLNSAGSAMSAGSIMSLSSEGIAWLRHNPSDSFDSLPGHLSSHLPELRASSLEPVGDITLPPMLGPSGFSRDTTPLLAADNDISQVGQQASDPRWRPSLLCWNLVKI